MKEQFEKVYINRDEKNLPKKDGEYDIQLYDNTRKSWAFYRKSSLIANSWINQVAWYLQPIEPKQIEAEKGKEQLLLKVIEKYQAFTRWVTRHTPEIEQSERGLNLLNDIDWAEHKVREYEQSLPKEPTPELRDELIKFVKYYFQEEQCVPEGSSAKMVDEYLNSKEK